MITKVNRIIRLLRDDSRPLHRIVGTLLRKLPFDVGTIFKIKIRAHDFYIRFHSSSLSIEFWCNPYSRKSDYDFITSYLKEGDIYIDLGANIGTILIPAAKLIAKGKAIGVEPHPRIFSYLKQNVSLNNSANNVELHNCAVGNHRGRIVISDKRRDDTNRVDPQGKGMRVPIILLDDIAQKYSRINLLKIDVEGYEKFVCDGGARTLAKTDCVYFEACEESFKKYGYSMKELFTTLEKMNFRIFRRRDGKANTIISVYSEYVPPKHNKNVLGIRDVGEFLRRTGWQMERNKASAEE